MAQITGERPNQGDAIVDYDEKLFDDIQAGEGEKAYIFMHTVPFEGSVGFVNMLTACLSAFVISRFAGSLEKMVALAVLMPVVASMGGNAGTQTMTVAVRALATRELNRGNAFRVLRRELLVGVLNGLGFAIILGLMAAIAFKFANLGMVIGLAMVIVLICAALGGLVIPLMLDRFGVDPAVSSGPFVTTVTDVVGFLSFLGIATLWFGLG